jgi:hypothetical protein
MDHTLKIGRIVHFRNSAPTLGCRPAIITSIGEETVELTVFGETTIPIGKCYKGAVLGYSWHWPDECPEGR